MLISERGRFVISTAETRRTLDATQTDCEFDAPTILSARVFRCLKDHVCAIRAGMP